MKLLVLNGPNLNFLGIREPDIYGKQDYETLKQMILNHAKELGIGVDIYQSNHEGDLVDKLQEAYVNHVDGIVFNPAAYTHTSVALHDALKAIDIPTVEVHISNVSLREDFRQINFIRDCCVYSVVGKGFDGYLLAMDYLKEHYAK